MENKGGGHWGNISRGHTGCVKRCVPGHVTGCCVVGKHAARIDLCSCVTRDAPRVVSDAGLVDLSSHDDVSSVNPAGVVDRRSAERTRVERSEGWMW